MKKYRPLLLLAVILALCLVVFPTAVSADQSGTQGSLTWTLTDSGVMTISGNGPIEDTSHIGFWHSYRLQVKQLIIMPGVTELGDLAFMDFANLTSVTIPNTVTRIGRHAFSGCDSLTELTIPGSVTTIEVTAFKNCSKLSRISVEGTNRAYASDDSGALYSKDKTFLLLVFSGKADAYTLPAGVTEISAEAFDYCNRLPAIYVAEGNRMYADVGGVLHNKNKTQLLRMPRGFTGAYTIAEGVQTVDDHAFYECAKLTELTVPASVTWLPVYHFYGVDSLRFIRVAAENTRYSSDSYGALFSKDKKELYYLPAAYAGSYTIPASVTFTGLDSFEDCKQLTAVYVDKNNTTYSSVDGVVYNKAKTAVHFAPPGFSGSHVIPDGVTQIWGHAFYKCINLTSITIPQSITHIPHSTFAHCQNLGLVILGNGLKEIDEMAFYDCPKLSNVYYYGTQQQWNQIELGPHLGLDNATIYYRSQPLNGWILVGNDWYYFRSGSMVTGWLKYSKDWYYLLKDGRMYTGFLQHGGNWYYLNKTGEMATGWVFHNSSWYYMDAEGHRVTGTQTISGKHHKFDGNGVWLGEIYPGKNGWVQENGKWYYYQNEAKRTGWLQLGSTWYYLKSSGEMVTGWLKYGPEWYYFNASGAMVTGWLKYGNQWYYLNSEGRMHTGWLEQGGKTYYLDANGCMITGHYYRYPPGQYHIFDSNGALQYGWIYRNGNWYYSTSSGCLATGIYLINGKRYFFQSGFQYGTPEAYGIMRTNGWGQDIFTGSLYYLGADGVAYSGGTYTIQGKQYHFDQEGRCTNPPTFYYPPY